MTRHMITRLAVLGLFAAFATACATDQKARAPAASSGPVTLAAAGEQPGALEPGLAVRYVFGDFDHVDDVAARAGGAGKPDSVVPNLSSRG